MPLKYQAKFAIVGAVMLAVTGLAGCGLGVDDVQLNGKIFDAAGLTTSSAPRKTPKLAARSGLIVPPSMDKLPEPGSGQPADTTVGGVAGVQDHDQKKQVSQADLEREQAAYCKVHYEDAKIHGDQDADLARGPLGPCRGSIVNAISKFTKGDEEQ